MLTRAVLSKDKNPRSVRARGTAKPDAIDQTKRKLDRNNGDMYISMRGHGSPPRLRLPSMAEEIP
jgi:hypothetical protein